LQDNALVWKGEAFVADIRNVLNKFLGVIRTNRALDLFFRKYDIPKDTQMADARLINFSEKLLTGSIGSASAKILIAKVVKEEEVSLVEVLEILEESKTTIANNKKLREKSTELTQLTNQLKEANQELILKDQQKDEFLDTVAHELKTPITGIRAATELLLDEDDDMPSEIKGQFLSNILNDSERLSRLIHNILDFEKLATDRHSLNFDTYNLEDTLKKAVNGVHQIAANKEISISIQQNESVVFSYDEDRMLQVLTNLLSNAIKFCQPQIGKIVISYQIVNDEVMVCVNDNGKGVPEEDLEYIFNRFYQSKNQNTIKPEGSGLGLAICKRIVERHGGKIWAEAKNNPGTTFVFHLPYH
jgi:signal transduction histidine kinase